MNSKSIYSTGTMRSGGSLFQNLMSVHSEVIIFSGFVNFFRFYDSKYGQLTLKSSRKIIRDTGQLLPCLFLVLMFSDSYLLGHYTTLIFIFFSSFLYKDFEKN